MPHEPSHHRHAWWDDLLRPVELDDKGKVKAAIAMLIGEPAADVMDASGLFDALLNSAQPLAAGLQAQAGTVLKSIFDYIDQAKNE